MKRFLLITFALFISCLVYSQDTLVVIWEEQFADSIPDTWEVGPGTPEGAIWQWSATGRADVAVVDGTVTNALFYGNSGTLQSPSVDNGCMMYNSDVYDGGGIGVGQGPFPGTHSGTLTSPSIDCSEHQFVSIKMHQYARGNSNNVSTLLEVSNDGGMTWVDFPINPTVVSNSGTTPDDILLLDISNVAGNQPDVKLRFTWNGRYYYWLIDDVQLIETPKLNLALSDTLFYPAASFATPLSQISTDTMGFFGRVHNLGRDTQYNVVFKASVIDLNNEVVLFVDSTIVDTLPAFVTEVPVDIEGQFIPEGLDLGAYDIRYEVYLPGGSDFDTTDNNFNEEFITTENIFAKENGNLGGTRPGSGGDYQLGNLYRMSPLMGDGFKATLSQFGGVRSAADGPMDGANATVFMYKVRDNVLPDFSNFEQTTAGDGDDLELVGFNSFTYPNGYENNTLVDVDLLNIDGDLGIGLDAGGRYFLMVAYADAASNVFSSVSRNISYFFQISTILYTDEWFLGGFGPEVNAAVRMTIELVDATDTQPLKETALNLFPNPSSDELTVDLDLDTPGEAVIVIASSDGKIMMVREYDNVQGENLTFDVSKYPAGSYFVRVGTHEGTKTKQFVKID